MAQGKAVEAAAEYREAIRLKPDLADSHNNLGLALNAQGKRDEAVAEYREAIRLKPDDPDFHNNLGWSLWGQGKTDEAAAEYRAAIRLKPDLTEAHNNLGLALDAQGKRDEAVAEYREAIRHKPDFALPHNNLGHTLGKLGDYDGALAALRKGHELGSRQPGWSYPSARWVRDAEHKAAMAARLPAVLRGGDKPKDATEGLTFAQLCYDKGRHADAARLWADALKADSKLADDRQTPPRYDAACSAAMAGCGQGKDDPPPDEAAKATLRRQALDWLKAELAAWAKLLESAPAKNGPVVVKTLDHWKQDSDLAGVRDADALGKLPDREQAAWRDLWAAVDALLQKARPKGS